MFVYIFRLGEVCECKYIMFSYILRLGSEEDRLLGILNAVHNVF